MQSQTLNFQARIPTGTGTLDLQDLRQAVRQMRAACRASEWSALERFALAVMAESAVDRQTRAVLLGLQQ
jgi:hypothetical protein